MSDPEQDISVLGKRARNENNEAASNAEDVKGAPSPTVDDDDDGDDVGPMPMPIEAGEGSMKKKRKGVSVTMF